MDTGDNHKPSAWSVDGIQAIPSDDPDGLPRLVGYLKWDQACAPFQTLTPHKQRLVVLMFEGLVLGLFSLSPRVAASVLILLPESACPCVLSVDRSGQARVRREEGDPHELPLVNVVFVPPRHHDGIRAVFPTPDSSCARGVHPILRAFLPAIASANVATAYRGTLA